MTDRRWILAHTVAALMWAANSAEALAATKKKKKASKSTKKSKKSTKSKKKTSRPAPPPPPPPPQITRLEDRDALRQVLRIGGEDIAKSQSLSSSAMGMGAMVTPEGNANPFLSQRSSHLSSLRRLRQNLLSLPRTLYHQNDRIIYDAVLWDLGLQIEGGKIWYWWPS